MTTDISNKIRSDPFLYNLFSTQSPDKKFDQKKAFNWIKIPTGFESEKSKLTTIKFLSVNTYTRTQCSKILNSLMIDQGKDISFSENGHIGVGYTKGFAQDFFANPMASRNSSGSTRPVSLSNTLYNTVIKNYPATFYYNKKILFSPNLKWILYQLPNMYYDANNNIVEDDDKKSGYTPVYVLLYNTIHRKNFQAIYADIINKDSKNPFSTTNIFGPNTDYVTTLNKYCNAFTIKRYTSDFSNKKISHYGDPSCALAFGGPLAKLTLALSANITLKSLEDDFYRDGNTGYQKALNQTDYIDRSDPYCGFGSGKSPSLFVRDVASIVGVPNSESFMQILTNTQIILTAKGTINLPKDYNSNLPGNFVGTIKCAPRGIKLTQCKTVINSETGDITANNVVIQQICGGDKPQSGDGSGSQSGDGSGSQSGDGSGSQSGDGSGSLSGDGFGRQLVDGIGCIA